MTITTPASHRPGRLLVVVAALLVITVLTAGTALAQPSPTPAPPPSAPGVSLPDPWSQPPLPLQPVGGCSPDSPVPVCHAFPLPSSNPPVPQHAGPPPCQGIGCLPQPSTPAPSTGTQPGNKPSGDPNSGHESSCGITDIPACVNDAIDSFFRNLVTPALNSLLDLLGQTLLTTPTLDQLPRIAELWNSSWQIMLACYGMLILLGGIIVMGYETLQTRVSVKEILPRVIVGFLAGALSLWACGQAITLANALAQAILSGGVDANGVADTLKHMVLSSLNGGFFIIFVGLFLAVMLVALLLTYIVRVALTVILIAGAPLALMCHALPHTEGIARWWWKAFGGCLAIQLGQSLALITALRVFLSPGGFTFFGPTGNGLVNLLVSLALMYILFKIPFWVLGSIRGRGGGSVIGSLLKGVLAYKTFGLLGGLGAAPGGGKAPKGPQSSGPPDPYAKTQVTPQGQYMLPLNVKRQPRPKPTHQAGKSAPRSRFSLQGKQLELPLNGEWPENKPRLGRDGQYELPFDVKRQPPPQHPDPAQPTSSSTPRGRQLRLPADGEWPENKPRLGRDGQYRLPVEVKRVRPPRPSPQPDTPRRSSPNRQTRVPLDGEWPENKPRIGRDGQYQLPLNVHRTRKPSPPPAHRDQPPQQPRRTPRPRQRSLPLDLPKVDPPRPNRRPGGDST